MAFNVMAGYGTVLTIFEIAEGASYTYNDEDAVAEAVERNMNQGLGATMFAYHLVGTGVFGLWYFLFCRPVKPIAQSFKRLSLPAIGWSLAIGISLCVFTTQLVMVAEYIVPSVVEGFYEMLEESGMGVSWFAIFAAIILAPIGEEFLCRGVIQHYAMKFTKRFWLANTIQALMFGIMHLNLVQGVYAFFIGLALGWLRVRYKTILVPIIIHFVINFSTSSWLGYLLDGIPEGLALNFGVLLLAIGASIGILVLIGRPALNPDAKPHETGVESLYG
jgi:membrane protease YdiL (CAAX protease family)